MITKKKWDLLLLEMSELNVCEDDLDENFILGSGSGGQKLQKSSSCVYLKHRPTGVTVKCQDSRLRDSNRYFARKRLCDKIETLLLKKESAEQKRIEKIRRQKKRRSRRAKQKILNEKHQQSQRKALRKKPEIDD